LVRTLALRASNDLEINGDLETNSIDLYEFSKWVNSKYSKSYSATIMSYVKRYCYIVNNGNIRDLDNLPATIKDNCVKSLIILSKYLGTVQAFRSKLKDYDIKLSRPSTLSSFLRILNSNNNDTMQWYKEVTEKLGDNEQLFTKFLLYNGLRTSEAINGFNLIIQLSKQNKLNEYYDKELNVLCHFKYPKLFIRRTKNCYITFIMPEFLSEITTGQPLTYSSIRKRLERNHMKLRLNELRDKFGTHLLSHGILEAEINLCQGRIPVDIFIRHYWSPKLKELGCRIFKALETIDTA
jgi:intergrase/recombinase